MTFDQEWHWKLVQRSYPGPAQLLDFSWAPPIAGVFFCVPMHSNASRRRVTLGTDDNITGWFPTTVATVQVATRASPSPPWHKYHPPFYSSSPLLPQCLNSNSSRYAASQGQKTKLITHAPKRTSQFFASCLFHSSVQSWAYFMAQISGWIWFISTLKLTRPTLNYIWEEKAIVLVLRIVNRRVFTKLVSSFSNHLIN